MVVGKLTGLFKTARRGVENFLIRLFLDNYHFEWRSILVVDDHGAMATQDIVCTIEVVIRHEHELVDRSTGLISASERPARRGPNAVVFWYITSRVIRNDDDHRTVELSSPLSALKSLDAQYLLGDRVRDRGRSTECRRNVVTLSCDKTTTIDDGHSRNSRVATAAARKS